MSKTLIVNNTPFEYPTKGDEPGWGGPATDWASEVTDVLSNLLGPDDILETPFNIANGQAVPADITALIFNAGSMRSSVVNYSVFRSSTVNPSGNTETGEIVVSYDNNEGFSIGIGNIVGNSGVNFSILPSGQIQYTSTDIDPLNYIGVLKFRAKSLQQ